ncbi:type IV toxin-antitoxin system AbiEi family antitoxin domain-containing protein [Myxococcota bacterium]|nr:type IV toxin-antitoxin system AbiEi family antitoxin domain-containing protein [Myxococcota bacterium]
MAEHPTPTEQVLAFARERGILRPRDLGAAGLSTIYLTRLVHRGDLVRLGRGLYAVPDLDLTEHHTLAEVARIAPRAVVCLLSALRFHDLSTENPHEVWIALPRHAWKPRSTGVPLRVTWLPLDLLDADVEEHVVEGVPVKVFTAARTVADCFRHRKEVGHEAAVAALRDYLRRYPRGLEDLRRCAERRRVLGVIRPFVEALT